LSKYAIPEGEPKPQNDTEGYWFRKAQEALAETESLRGQVTELQQNTGETETLRKQIARQQAIMDAELPSELANLVPVECEDFNRYIADNLVPLKEKMREPAPFGNSPVPNGPIRQADKIQMLVNRYRELDRVNQNEALQFYAKYRHILEPALANQG